MVRVRFAPSPTGYLHIGNARTALFNWLFAHKHKGSFILRVEDTDIARSKKTYTQQLMSDLRWLKMNWDEGPDIGGGFGPYKQSNRLKIYRRAAESLLRKGKVYRCYCSEEELEARRKEALRQGRPPRYDNRCRNLTSRQIADFESRGIKECLRFKVPDRTIIFNDLVKGEVSFDLGLIGDFVIMKSDMQPAFNFAVTVDDWLMKITHVIRGEDHISNTPRHLLLFDGLGAKAPAFAHMPMTLASGGTRLSKRAGAMSIAEYRHLGYLPEALINYLVLLGWSPKNDREIFSRDELIKEFDLSGITKANAVFDEKKLRWFGGQYIRKADLDRLTNLAIGYLKREDFIKGAISEEKYEWIKKITAAVRDHLSCVSEIADYVDIFFKERIEIADNEKGFIEDQQGQEVLKAAIEVLGELDELTSSNFNRFIRTLQDKTGVKGKSLYLPIRIAITGKAHGPELNLVLPILEKRTCLERIKRAIKISY